MKKIDYHFIGIGGIGMSGLAEILLARGFNISGSDLVENYLTEKLKKKGVTIYLGQSKDNISLRVKKVIVSGAINQGNAELVKARQLKIPILSRSELLGSLMDEKKGIAITGTHGKTTTSSLISTIFKEAELDPTILIGGEVKSIGGNAQDGKGKYLIAEACEYQRAFLDLRPQIGVILNIEADHLDYYTDLDDIENAFLDFVKNIRKDGFLVAGVDSPSVTKVISKTTGRIITYGISSTEAQWKAVNIRTKKQQLEFDVMKKNQSLGKFTLRVPGFHNIQNALAAIIVSLECGVKLGTIKSSINKFQGALRRMELKGEQDGILVFDDYAHHPSEIKSTLSGLRNFYPNRKIFCVFQPHQYSRTKYLMTNFGESFKEADVTIIPEIYAVRDTKADIEAVSGEDLTGEIKKKGQEAYYIPSFPDCVKFLKEKATDGDIIITMGAGPVNKIAEDFLGKKPLKGN